MDIDVYRYSQLQQSLVGYEKTGLSLIGYDGKNLRASGIADDLGIYYFIPKISHIFHLSISQGIEVFFTGIIVLSYILGSIGIFLLFRNWISRIFGLCALLFLALITYKISDTYIVAPCVAIAIIPLFLYFVKIKKHQYHWLLPGFLFLAGIDIGLSHCIRAHAGTAVILFITIILFFYSKFTFKNKFILIALLLVGFTIPIFYFQSLFHQRDAYFKKLNPQYENTVPGHVFWFPMYSGFGYLNNPYGFKYDDRIGYAHLAQISPNTPANSPQSEKIFQKEDLHFIRTNIYFILETIFSKLGTIAMYFLIFTNIGLFAAYFYRKPVPLEAAFWSAILFSSLFCILTVPYLKYLLGFAAFSVLYAIVSIDYALEKKAKT